MNHSSSPAHGVPNTRAAHRVRRWNRREILRVGGLGAVGLSLADALRAADGGGLTTRRADSCIVIFLNGGPSHLDMWDMKPNGPIEIRGEFQPISSSLPGVPKWRIEGAVWNSRPMPWPVNSLTTE